MVLRKGKMMVSRLKRFAFLVVLPGIGALLVEVLSNGSDNPVARWCVVHWWQLMVARTVFFCALRTTLFLLERRLAR